MSDDLDQIWEETQEGAFEAFIQENIGFDEEDVPLCFGSGDGSPWCEFCKYQPSC